MKTSKILALILAVVMIMGTMGIVAFASGNTLIVDATNQEAHATVEAAIDAAASGDTIILAAGVYEAFTVSKEGLTFEGTVDADGNNLTTIKALCDTATTENGGVDLMCGGITTFRNLDFTAGTVTTNIWSSVIGFKNELNTKNPSVVVENCEFQGSGVGFAVYMPGSGSETFTNCIINNFTRGIGGDTVSGNISVTGTTITECAYPAHAGTAYVDNMSFTIENSNVSGGACHFGSGVNVEFSEGTTLSEVNLGAYGDAKITISESFIEDCSVESSTTADSITITNSYASEEFMNTYADAIDSDNSSAITEIVATVNGKPFATIREALIAADAVENSVVQLPAGEFTHGAVKFPASLTNVTIEGAANKGTIIKNSTFNSSDGNNVNYVGLTIDGIVFEASNIIFTGARNGEVIYKDLAITNCEFRNVVDTSSRAAIHFNLASDEKIENITISGNIIDNISGSSNSGIRMNYVTGNVVIENNKISNTAWNGVQIINTVENATLEFNGNEIANAGAGIANLYNFAGDISADANIFRLSYEGQSVISGATGAITLGANNVVYDENNNVTENVNGIVAKVDGKHYTNFKKAVEAAAEGSTITLLSDIDVGSYENGWSGDTYYSLRIGAGKEVTLDLNGKTLKSTGGSNTNHYAIIQNDGKLTITDSSAEKTGKIVNEATLLMAGKMSRTIYNQGSNGGTSLIINGGTIENTVANKIEDDVTVENYYPYAIDSITAGDVALTISDDAKIIANNFYAIRARSQGGSGTQTVSISGGEIVGGLGVDLKIAELEGKSDTMNLTISGGKITGSDESEALRVVNYAVNVVPAEADTISVTGGEFIGKVISIDGNNDTNTPAFGGFLNGGSYTVKPDETLLTEGFAVGAISNGIYEVVEPVIVKYENTVKNGKVVEGSWDIIIDRSPTSTINEFVAAELVLSNDASRVEGGYNEERMNYNIYGIDGKTVAGLNFGSPLNDAANNVQVYRINTIDGVDKINISGHSLVIGTIVFDGKGTPDIAVLEGSTVILTKEGTYDEAYFTTTEKTLIEEDFDAEGGMATTKRNVTIKIDFEHDINAQVNNDYKFMTVTLKDSIGNTFTKEGADINIKGVNSGEVVFEDVTIGIITVTLKAPGFRTYTYQTTMEDIDAEFVLNFWNSVKRSGDWCIEEGNDRSKMMHNFLAGDIAMDYIVDKYDLAAVTSYYGIYDINDSTDTKYIEKLVKYDLNRDGDIDILDVAYVLHGMGN